MSWLTKYFMTAKQTDQLVGTLKHTELLAADLFVKQRSGPDY